MWMKFEITHINPLKKVQSTQGSKLWQLYIHRTKFLMLILTSCWWVIFEIKYSSLECRALHLIICQAECRAHWNLPPPHRVFFDFDWPLYWKNRNNLSFKAFEGRVFCVFWRPKMWERDLWRKLFGSCVTLVEFIFEQTQCKPHSLGSSHIIGDSSLLSSGMYRSICKCIICNGSSRPSSCAYRSICRRCSRQRIKEGIIGRGICWCKCQASICECIISKDSSRVSSCTYRSICWHCSRHRIKEGIIGRRICWCIC